MIKMVENKFLLYVQTSDDPERQYSPLILAQTAKAMDIDAKVYYLGQGLRILKGDTAKKIKMGNFPSVYDTLRQCLEMGIEVYVCEASKQMLGWDKVELLLGLKLKIVGAGTLNDLVLDAAGTMWF
jgi:predicted peroxiredoxin